MIDGAPFFQKIILIQFQSSPSTRQRGISLVGFEYQLLQLQSRYSKHDCAQGVLEPNFIEHDLRKKQEKDVKPSNTGTLVRNTCAQKFVWIRFSKFTLTPWSTFGICNRNAVILWDYATLCNGMLWFTKIWAETSFLSWKTSKSLQATILPLDAKHSHERRDYQHSRFSQILVNLHPLVMPVPADCLNQASVLGLAVASKTKVASP